MALSLAPTARKASEAVGSLTKTRAFRSEVAAITGYDVTQMGRVLLERWVSIVKREGRRPKLPAYTG